MRRRISFALAKVRDFVVSLTKCSDVISFDNLLVAFSYAKLIISYYGSLL